MKIIDKTPLLDEKGNLTFAQRVQGMLQFGFNWPKELEAQKAIVSYFERQLEKGYTLIRNMPLGASGIVVPMILLGPTGIYVIEVSHLRGRYEARGDQWNVEAGNQYKPAPVNLIQRTMRMANALTAYIERQGVKLAVPVEPVLIAGDPGLHIESERPAIKVMMIDGIKGFVSGLVNGKPILRADFVIDYTERILNPRAKPEPIGLPPEPEPEQHMDWDRSLYGDPVQQPEPSRARAIFESAPAAQTFDPNNFDFALAEDDSAVQDIPPVKRNDSNLVNQDVDRNPAKAMRQPKPKQQLIMGMTPVQVAVIAVLGLALLCVIAAFAYVVITR
jgi:nuclease-like protein